MSRKRMIGQMHAVISRLSEAKQAVLRMRDMEMRSFEEIARRLGLPSAGAARKLRAYALVELLHTIETEGTE
ncbi:MAG: sigma factor-like helix-turn-helix DNA-binding protein [Planctomycetota bacterium]|jgi:DNA-directed RNA polymerase specialized sigma24 family protein